MDFSIIWAVLEEKAQLWMRSLLSHWADSRIEKTLSQWVTEVSPAQYFLIVHLLVGIQSFVWALYLHPAQLFSDSPLFWISHRGETSMRREGDSRQGPLNGALLGGIKTKLPFRLSERISQLHSPIFKQAGSKCTLSWTNNFFLDFDLHLLHERSFGQN